MLLLVLNAVVADILGNDDDGSTPRVASSSNISGDNGGGTSGRPRLNLFSGECGDSSSTLVSTQAVAVKSLSKKKPKPPLIPSAPLTLPDSLAPGTEHLHATDAHLVRLFRAARPMKQDYEVGEHMYIPTGPMGVFNRSLNRKGPPYEFWTPPLAFEEARLQLFLTRRHSRSPLQQAEYEAEVAAFAREEIRRAHTANADGWFEELLCNGTSAYRAGECQCLLNVYTFTDMCVLSSDQAGHVRPLHIQHAGDSWGGLGAGRGG